MAIAVKGGLDYKGKSKLLVDADVGYFDSSDSFMGKYVVKTDYHMFYICAMCCILQLYLNKVEEQITQNKHTC